LSAGMKWDRISIVVSDRRIAKFPAEGVRDYLQGLCRVGRLYYSMCGVPVPEELEAAERSGTLDSEQARTTSVAKSRTRARTGAVAAGSFPETQYPEAVSYYAIRDGRRVIEHVSFAQVQANAARWKSTLIEVRGVIHGCSPDRCTFIITREEGDTFVVLSRNSPPASTVDIARTVRVLAQIPPDRDDFGSLQLVAVTSEYEAASLEYERAKRRR
jgi:hypothetical protein